MAGWACLDTLLALHYEKCILHLRFFTEIHSIYMGTLYTTVHLLRFSSPIPLKKSATYEIIQKRV